MGLIRAAGAAIGGTLADQWIDAFEAVDMSDTTVLTTGVRLRAGDKRNTNTKGTEDLITNGSMIHVAEGQGMLLTDGGKIIDYTMEAGYYKVDNSSQPSVFNGEFKDSLMDAWNRFKFGGGTPLKQKVYFLNLQEIKGIKFGTSNPVNYFDNFYNAELFLRAFGNYSIKITNPILFFIQAIPRDAVHVDINDINEQYLSEFLSALQSSINQMSVDGIRISQVASKSRELSQYMADTLDNEWEVNRGFKIQAVGLQSISYDDESKEIINMRNKGAMLQDPSIREGYVQGAVARGMEAAGSNTAGAGASFMGMGIGMTAGGGFMGQSSNTNMQQMQMQQQQQQQYQQPMQQQYQQPMQQQYQQPMQQQYQQPMQQQYQQPMQQAPGGPAVMGGAAVGAGYTCSNCGTFNAGGKFCGNCGTKHEDVIACPGCGFKPTGEIPKFCPECGSKF